METMRMAMESSGLRESPGRRFKTKFYICPKCGRDVYKGTYCPCQSQVVDVRVSDRVIRRRCVVGA